MSHYARRVERPDALTPDEQAAILRVSGEHISGARDHVIILLALRVGLREHELAALDVADVLAPRPEGRGRGRSIRRRLRLRAFKGSGRGRGRRRPGQWAVIPDDVRRQLERHVRGLVFRHGPLFLSRLERRLSTRQIRTMWHRWQAAAGLDPRPFHILRHTYVTELFRRGVPADVVRRLARHARLETTQIYAHPTEADLILAANRPARAPRMR